jgi:hypothetical protein
MSACSNSRTAGRILMTFCKFHFHKNKNKKKQKSRYIPVLIQIVQQQWVLYLTPWRRVRVRESESRYGWRSVNQSVLVSKLVYILFKDPVRTSKRAPHFTITSINFLTLFKEIIAVYIENHAKPINTKYSIYWVSKQMVHTVTARP